MVDASREVVATLKEATNLEIYYELAVDSKTTLPAITYQTYNNYDEEGAIGETFGYSRVQYQIKLWGYKINDMMPILLKIDSTMRKMGFTRIAKSELTTDTQICYINLYEARAIEDYE